MPVLFKKKNNSPTFDKLSKLDVPYYLALPYVFLFNLF